MTMKTNEPTAFSFGQFTEDTEIGKWFDDLVATLKTHRLQLETHTINDEMRKFYDVIIGGQPEEVFSQTKKRIQKHFVSEIIVNYLKLLNDNLPSKLAFDFNDSEVLVWAEVEENDDKLQYQLIMNEAKINSMYHGYGFDMSSTIVEKSDCLNTPNHYRTYK